MQEQVFRKWVYIYIWHQAFLILVLILKQILQELITHKKTINTFRFLRNGLHAKPFYQQIENHRCNGLATKKLKIFQRKGSKSSVQNVTVRIRTSRFSFFWGGGVREIELSKLWLSALTTFCLYGNVWEYDILPFLYNLSILFSLLALLRTTCFFDTCRSPANRKGEVSACHQDRLHPDHRWLVNKFFQLDS